MSWAWWGCSTSACQYSQGIWWVQIRPTSAPALPFQPPDYSLLVRGTYNSHNPLPSFEETLKGDAEPSFLTHFPLESDTVLCNTFQKAVSKKWYFCGRTSLPPPGFVPYTDNTVFKGGLHNFFELKCCTNCDNCDIAGLFQRFLEKSIVKVKVTLMADNRFVTAGVPLQNSIMKHFSHFNSTMNLFSDCTKCHLERFIDLHIDCRKHLVPPLSRAESRFIKYYLTT